MFKQHLHYEATCAGPGCTNALLDANLSRYYSDNVPEQFHNAEEAGRAAADARWAVVDGKLLCDGCVPDDLVDDTAEVTTTMLTAYTTWTVHCDTCQEAYVDGESGDDVHLYNRVLDEWTLDGLAYAEWEVTETTPTQSEALFDVPGGAKRTWEATCGECIAETAWREQLAAAA
jgi:hypothetical protein